MQKCISCGKILPYNKFKYQGTNRYNKSCKDCVRLSKEKSGENIHPAKIWSFEKVKSGFDEFFKQYGRYPTALEIDIYPKLPSSRNIQRYFGGLVNLRKKFGYEITSYAKGEFRSKTAGIYNVESRVSESDVRNYLDKRFGEICVHEERKYGEGGNTLDFYVYAKENFGVDVFKTHNYHNLAGNINIKFNKYQDFTQKLYFVLVGGDFEQTKIDNLMKNKKNPLPGNMRCLIFQEFIRECERNEPIHIDVSYQKYRKT